VAGGASGSACCPTVVVENIVSTRCALDVEGLDFHHTGTMMIAICRAGSTRHLDH
jgi:hypothetical protein